MDARPEPLDHAGIVSFPALLEQALLGKAVLRIEHEDLGIAPAGALQHMGHHRHPLIRPGRAAIGIGRSDDHDDALVRHGVEPALQERRLRPGPPGMRHGLLMLAAPAGHRIVFEVDAGREHEPVIGEARAVGEQHLALVAIDPARGLRIDLEAVGGCDLVVAVGDRGKVAIAAEKQVGVETGDELALRLDQHDLDGALAVLGDVFRRRHTA